MAELVERRRPLRRDEYEHMVQAGFFEGERVELVRGVIVEMSPQNIPHSAAIQLLNRWLQPALVGRADVRVQLPFNVGDDSVPEPDFALVAPVIKRDAHPSEAFLIIEVADASLAYDRREKTGLYASAGLPEYWIVNLVDRAVEKYSEPSGGAYARLVTVRVGDAVAPLAFPDVSITVDEIVGADR